jgi:non-homologous end joining protein Ku
MQHRLAATWERRPALTAALRYPYEIVDRYEEAVVAMLKKRKGRAGLPVSREYALARPQSAVNLVEALRGSIAAGSHLYVG